jgi:hypothetical protein
MLLALATQLVSVCLLRARLGRRWLGRPFTLFVLMAIVFHGVSELLIHTGVAFARSPRWSVEQSYIDDAVLAVSAALLACVLGYMVVVRPIGSPAPPLATVRSNLRLLDWRITGVAALPLLVATVGGKGYGNQFSYSLAPATILIALSNTFLVILVILTAFSFVLRHGRRWLVPVLATQSVVLAVVGQRIELFVGAVVLLCLLYHVNIRLGRGAVAVALAVAAVAALGITSARDSVGRGYFREDSGFVGRSKAIAMGTLSPPDPARLWGEAAFRFDGNSFAGQVDKSVQSGSERLGAAAILDSLVVTVPSVLHAEKHSTGRGRSMEHQAVARLNVLPIDYAPGAIGPYLGAVGRPELAFLMVLVGLAFALVENWLLTRLTLNRILILASLFQGVLFFAKELSGILVFVRTGLLLVLVAMMLRWCCLLCQSRRSVELGR